MKHSILPALIPIAPVTLTLAALSLLGTATQAQTSVVVGTNVSYTSTPFGSSYLGEYQQVYTASALSTLGSGSFTLTSLAFKTDDYQGFGTGPFQSNFTYSFFYTSATPTTLSNSYAANKGAAASPTYTSPGAFVALTNNTFDVVLPTSFVYTPSLGNLLLDVSITSNSGRAFFALGPSSDTNCVFNAPGAPGSTFVGGFSPYSPSYNPAALQTQFTAAPAPEPSAVTGLLVGILGLGALALCARRRVV